MRRFSGCEALPELRRGRRGVLQRAGAEPLLMGCGLLSLLRGSKQKGEAEQQAEKPGSGVPPMPSTAQEG